MAVPDGWPSARFGGCTEPGLQAGSPAAASFASASAGQRVQRWIGRGCWLTGLPLQPERHRPRIPALGLVRAVSRAGQKLNNLDEELE